MERPPTVTEGLHSIPLTMIAERQVSFGDFKGKTVLVVDVASKCGFSPVRGPLSAIFVQGFRDTGRAEQL